MTGYGQGSAGSGAKKISASIKAVNGRYLDVKIRGIDIEPSVEKQIRDIITEKLIIPDAEWHEAFYMAQQLFKFPKEFEFPSLKGKEKEIKLEKKFKKDSWISELQINRKENRFTKIEYHYKNKGLSKVVSIYKESGQLVISKTEEVK